MLHGVGGVGKTTLADELIARVVDLDGSGLVTVVRNQVTVGQVIEAILDTMTDTLHDSRPVWATNTVLNGLRQARDGGLRWQRLVEIRATVCFPRSRC